MTYAEQQYRAHIARQKRLGNTAAKPARLLPWVAPPAGAADSNSQHFPPTVPGAQADKIEALEREVADLVVKVNALVREDRSPLVLRNRVYVVVRAVAKFYGVSLADIVSLHRPRELARPRHVAMYLAKQLTRNSLSRIGRLIDRHHTTVLHGCQRIAMLRQQDPQLDREINTLMERLTLKIPGEPADPQDGAVE